MSIQIRPYNEQEYPALLALYKNSALYGGVFDENRDSETKLKKRIEADPDAILVAEQEGHIVGSVSLIEDGRVAWLFRFAVVTAPNELEVAKLLLDKANEVLSKKGHTQVLVYTPVGNSRFNNRYEMLGFTKGSDYTCFWKDI
jgi:predicted N-acetyltransferase YhbS